MTESVSKFEGSLEQCRLVFSDGSRCINDCTPHEQYCPDCLEEGLTDFAQSVLSNNPRGFDPDEDYIEGRMT